MNTEVSDFRRGSLRAVHRRCGKPTCVCASDSCHPGHGAQYNFTRWEDGRTVTRHLKPGPELEKVEREVATYQVFRNLVGQAIDVNEQICDARRSDAQVEKGLYREAAAELQASLEEEADKFLSRLEDSSLDSLEAAEVGLREGLLKTGGRLFEKRLAGNPGYCGPRTDCGHGHQAEFQDYRSRRLESRVTLGAELRQQTTILRSFV